MPDEPTWSRILNDRSLSREARIMALYLEYLGGSDEHRVSTEDWQRILGKGPRGFPKRHTIAGHLQELELAGWVARRAGGPGSPFYRITPLSRPPRVRAERSFPVPPGDTQAFPSPQGTPYEVPPGDGKAPFPSPQGTPRLHVVVGGEEVVVVGDVARARYELHLDVVAYLGSDTCVVAGARKAIRDYFTDRVPTARQWGYLSTVRSWLDGGIGAPKGLLDLPDPVDVIHTALNELLQLTAEDEVKMFKAARGKAGSTDTLRSKIEYLIRRGQGPAATGTDDHRPRPTTRTPHVEG